jgi:signal transduction histidine kinase
VRLADFILSNLEPILREWETFARSIGAGEHLDQLALRDHAEQILQATARDMISPQNAALQARKSKGLEDDQSSSDLDGASNAHAIDRLGHGFNMMEIMSEYRALRASVLHLWRDSRPDSDGSHVDDLTRFNESIDQSLSKAVDSYTKRVEHARDTFLAILGHDLRSPLSAISMAGSLIPLVRTDEAETLQCTSIVSSSVSLMERMINDLLDFTRTRLGAGMPIKPVPMDLVALGGNLTGVFQAAHPSREIEFHHKGDLNGLWDSDRIRQAISNLMRNALQHGSSELPVTLSLLGEESSVVIEVHNGGNLIPASEIYNIFDPLVRGSSTETSSAPASGSIGLGLYIAREVAESHGGKIDVTSTITNGTTFTIRLPRQTAAAQNWLGSPPIPGNA